MRARNLQTLTDAIKRKHPGVVIYGIGDAAHKLVSSDHNEDDTPGSKAAQTDADNVAEHRAIDVMLGPAFTSSNANKLVLNLISEDSSRSRLFYIIWNERMWSRSFGWVSEPYNGDDPHTNHVHISGYAAQDDNVSPWTVLDSNPSSPSNPATPPTLHRVWPRYMPNGHYFGLITGPTESHGGYFQMERADVKAIQQRLISLGFVPGISNPNSSWADGLFQSPTKDAVTRWQRKKYPNTTTRFGEVWSDDWSHLFTY